MNQITNVKMAEWQGWVAALGGLVAIVSQWVQGAELALLWIGGLAAVVFGIWASSQ